MSDHTTPARIPEQDQVEYRPVVGFPGYRVGNDGSVWGCWRQRGVPGKKDGGSIAYLSSVWRRLSPHPTGDRGYLTVGFKRDGKLHHRRVHRVVLEAFVGPCPEGMEGCHFPDRTVTNCRLDNLRWDTRKANHADKKVHGTQPSGEQCHSHKLTWPEVRAIRDLGKAGVRRREIARRFSVSVDTVRLILIGEHWKEAVHEPAPPHAPPPG